MTLGRGVFNAVLAIVLMAAPVAAQSLGDLARQEAARRASTRKAVKTLSNADLDPSAIAAPAGTEPAEPSCYMSKSRGQCVSADEMVTLSVAGVVSKENAPFEPTWRRDAQDLRSQIGISQNAIATLEAAIADPERSPGKKRVDEKTLAGARQTLAALERRWEKLEKEAANQHIPREWIEPIPVLTKNQPGQ